jgi:hypothetical protein
MNTGERNEEAENQRTLWLFAYNYLQKSCSACTSIITSTNTIADQHAAALEAPLCSPLPHMCAQGRRAVSQPPFSRSVLDSALHRSY